MREVVIKVTMPDNWVKDVCKKYPTPIKFIECMPYGKSGGRGLIEIKGEKSGDKRNGIRREIELTDNNIEITEISAKLKTDI